MHTAPFTAFHIGIRRLATDTYPIFKAFFSLPMPLSETMSGLTPSAMRSSNTPTIAPPFLLAL